MACCTTAANTTDLVPAGNLPRNNWRHRASQTHVVSNAWPEPKLSFHVAWAYAPPNSSCLLRQVGAMLHQWQVWYCLGMGYKSGIFVVSQTLLLPACMRSYWGEVDSSYPVLSVRTRPSHCGWPRQSWNIGQMRLWRVWLYSLCHMLCHVSEEQFLWWDKSGRRQTANLLTPGGWWERAWPDAMNQSACFSPLYCWSSMWRAGWRTLKVPRRLDKLFVESDPFHRLNSFKKLFWARARKGGALLQKKSTLFPHGWNK